MVIQINIADKRAAVVGDPVIICGNGGYSIEFSFDSGWDNVGTKTARFVYVRAGEQQHQDVEFDGTTVAVPVLAGVSEVQVGVFAANLRASTPVRIPCELSIRCAAGTA